MSLFRRKDLIESLCQRSGWWVAGRERDRYLVRCGNHTTVHYIDVRHGDGMSTVRFQAAFPVRFPLDHEPAGLFARLLMRNIALRYVSWHMDIQESCEGLIYLSGQWPVVDLPPQRFNAICRELTEEIAGFHEELRDKFRYASPRQEYGTRSQQNHGGVPMRMPWDNVPEIRYFSE